LGAAYVSALTLLAAVSDLGLSSAIIRFAPSMGSRQIDFLNAAATVVVLTSLAASVLFLLGIPLWSPGMIPLIRSLLACLIFGVSATVFSLAQLVDKVFVAFEVTHFMFLRNLLSNVVRVALIVVASRFLGAAGLVLAVGGGALFGLLLAAGLFVPRTAPGYRLRPALDWPLLRDKAGYSLGNHFATLVWSVPALVYPLAVVSLLGPGANARFYVSWMIANLLFIIPVSISTSAFARASNAGRLEGEPFWRTMWLTLASLLLPSLGLMAGAPIVLRLFGAHYSAQGPALLILLVLSVFPYTVNTAVITFHRIERNVARMVWLSGSTILLCLLLSMALGRANGLTGIGLGWLAGQLLGVVLSLLSRVGREQSELSPIVVDWQPMAEER
jgi:O-antigen/teichoic acid export membrane protein